MHNTCGNIFSRWNMFIKPSKQKPKSSAVKVSWNGYMCEKEGNSWIHLRFVVVAFKWFKYFVIYGVRWHKLKYLIIIKSRLPFPSLPENRCLYMLTISIYFFILHKEKLWTDPVNVLKITSHKVLIWITPWDKVGLACTILCINLGAAFSNASVKLKTLIFILK